MKFLAMKNIAVLLLVLLAACQQTPKEPVTVIPDWVPYDESAEIAANADHESARMRYKLIQSKVSDKNETWKNLKEQVSSFSASDYEALKPLILEQDIPTIQSHIQSGKLTYENLTQWYLYRIVQFENNKDLYLNAIISINPDAVATAKKLDENKSDGDHLIYGMPVLLKDNVNFAGLPTTAGAVALKDNLSENDAFIVERIEEKGGIILGKVNLSEWANYLANVNPNGYSAIGGQTLNPYGRKIHDTGGSSAASGVSMAANYAAAAVGTETSGSILSPSSSNSIVGLKPTIGLLSRSGIVPISSTLDTPGPMTRNVTDNAILLSAMAGEDVNDVATKDNPKDIAYFESLKSGSLEGLRFGVIKDEDDNYLGNPLYKASVEQIAQAGAELVEVTPGAMNFEGFVNLLSADMKVDLPDYLSKYGSEKVPFKTVADVAGFNLQDTSINIPYGQGRFDHIEGMNLSKEELMALRDSVNSRGKAFFKQLMDGNDLDGVLSINNWNAGQAAAAKYPCLTVPMGYSETGRPMGLTFIARPFEEDKLLQWGYAFEQLSKSRKIPADFQ